MNAVTARTAMTGMYKQHALGKKQQKKIAVCLDVELADTSSRDVDDTLLFILLAGDPRFELRCVTLTPGTAAQFYMAGRILSLITGDEESAVPIGCGSSGGSGIGKKSPKKWSKAAIALGVNDRLKTQKGEVEPISLQQSRDAASLLADCIQQYPGALVITGSSLSNLAGALSILRDRRKESLDTPVLIQHWLGQGGYPPESYLSSVQEPSVTCYNLTKDLDATRAVLGAVQKGIIAQGRLVSSKCHKENIWQELSPRLEVACQREYLAALYKTTSDRRQRKKSLDMVQNICSSLRHDKLLHDLLLLGIALDSSIASWTEHGVQLESTKTEQGRVLWKSTTVTSSQLKVTYRHDQEAYMETVLPLPHGVEVPDVKKTPQEESDNAARTMAPRSKRRSRRLKA